MGPSEDKPMVTVMIRKALCGLPVPSPKLLS